MKTSSHTWGVNITTETKRALGAATGLLLLAIAQTLWAATVTPKDALVLEQTVPVRQFADVRGKVIATLRPCDELLLLEDSAKKSSPYVEILFLSTDAQTVQRGWIKRNSPLYIFPEPRPVTPREDTTPQVAFPWGEKTPQPGDPDYARVTSKAFLFSCLANPHPTKVASIFSQLFDRYIDELTADEVVQLLPLFRYAREGDYARIRQLLQKFKDNPKVAEFLAANPLFGPVLQPEAQMAPVTTPTPAIKEEEGMSLPFGLTPKKVGIGLAGGALLLVIVALLLRKKKKPTLPDQTDTFMGGPSI